MTPEQQLVWDYLSWNPRRHAEKTGNKMRELANSKKPYCKTKFHKMADQNISDLMKIAPNKIEGIRVMYIWLHEYQLPFDSSKLESFDKFHEKYAHTISAILEKPNGHNILKC